LFARFIARELAQADACVLGQLSLREAKLRSPVLDDLGNVHLVIMPDLSGSNQTPDPSQDMPNEA
jgi:hypothetical protein